jgi:hypothetical protein
MECGKPSKARPNGGASLFGYLLGRLPKVTRRKGEKVTQERYKSKLSASFQKSKNQSKADCVSGKSVMTEAALRIPTSV